MEKGVTVRTVVEEGAALPLYTTERAAGGDLFAYLPNGEVTLPAKGGIALIPTGLIFEIPAGYEGQVRPRSGLAAKYGVTVLNSPGTIDSDYRGEVKIILINHGSQDFKVTHVLRIAQLVITPVEQGHFIEVGSLSETNRGDQGFGSTGV